MASRLPPYTPDVVNVDAIAATIRTQESGGNYTVANYGPNGASGAYQFTTPTWQSLTKRYSIGTGFPTASSAPPAIQDQIAKKYISDILSANKGDVLSVPYTWYVGNAQGTWTDSSGTHTPDDTPAGNHISVNDYVKKWFDVFKKASGQGNTDISLGDLTNTDIWSAAASGAASVAADKLNPISSVVDFLNWIRDAVFNRSNWIKVGMVVGALLLAVFGMMTVSKSFGGPGTADIAKGVALA